MAARIPGLFGAVAAFSAPFHPIRHPEVWLSGAAYTGIDGYRELRHALPMLLEALRA